jgi:2'-5' RNA ligase
MNTAAPCATPLDAIPDHGGRFFVAIKVPPALVGTLTALQHALAAALPRRGVRWVPPDQFHLTLLFLGWVARERLTDLNQQLTAATAEVAAFSLGVGGPGVFPDWRRPRVLWAGLTGELAALATLQQRVFAAGRAFVEKPEDRPFHAHLTLARISAWERPDGELVRRALAEAPAASPGSWQAAELLLIRSQPGPGGSQYTDVARFPLRTAP